MTETLRLDKWLWFARVCKTRSLAQKLCAAGQVRHNGPVTRKPSASVRVGDVIEVDLGRQRRTFTVKALGTRRGSAVDAALLFDEAPQPKPLSVLEAPAPVHRLKGAGRPTKKQRRALDKWRDSPHDAP